VAYISFAMKKRMDYRKKLLPMEKYCEINFHDILFVDLLLLNR